ncbi:hypothetical protein SAMN02799643_02124 [Methylobacterium sp. UNCCL125]|jgi:hypothetical protein|nr:hypothetical protein SAMN02799643_02124 [Methylobacterium sp. UNCCL125]
MIRTHAAYVDDVVDAELGGAETNVRWTSVARERRSGVAVPPVDIRRFKGDDR